MKFVSVIRKIASKLDIVACVAAFAMMIIVSANCIGRKINLPIPGTYDLSCFLLILITAPALANCAVEGGHTMLDMLTNKFSFKVQRILEIVISVICIVFCVVLSASLWQRFLNHVANGMTGATLPVPYWPFIFIEFISVVLYIFVCVCDVIVAGNKLKKGEEAI